MIKQQQGRVFFVSSIWSFFHCTFWPQNIFFVQEYQELWPPQQLSTYVLKTYVDINQFKDRMYISNNKYRLAELTEENLPESAKLLADSFIKENKVWNAIKPDEAEVRKFMFDKTREMIEWQNQLRENGRIGKETFLNFVYLNQDDTIVAVATNFELVHYLEKKSNVFLKQFEILQKYGHELLKNINPKDIVPGLSIYSMFAAMHQKWMGSGVNMCFWFDHSHYLHSQGFRVMYGRLSSAKSQTLMIKNGAECKQVMKVVEDGKQITLSFMRWHYDPIHYVRHLVEKFTTKARL